MNIRTILFFGFIAVATVSNAQITRLQANFTVDNNYSSFFSTNENTIGNPSWSGTGHWQIPLVGSADFFNPGTYYFNVFATRKDPQAMFIGSFSFNNKNAYFDATGTQTLETSLTTVKLFGDNPGGSPSLGLDLGANGSQPWGNIAPVNPGARFIWGTDASGALLKQVWFQTKFTVVPEPLTLCSFGLAAGFVALRKRSK